MLSRYYSVHHAQVTICDRCICYLIEVVKGIISIDTKCGDVEKATSCSCAICLLSVPRSCLITNVSCWISSALSSNNDLRLATNTHTHIHNYTYTHAFHFNSHFPSESGSPCGYLARFLQAKKPFLSPNQQCQRQWKERKPLSGDPSQGKLLTGLTLSLTITWLLREGSSLSLYGSNQMTLKHTTFHLLYAATSA